MRRFEISAGSDPRSGDTAAALRGTCGARRHTDARRPLNTTSPDASPGDGDQAGLCCETPLSARAEWTPLRLDARSSPGGAAAVRCRCCAMEPRLGHALTSGHRAGEAHAPVAAETATHYGKQPTMREPDRGDNEASLRCRRRQHQQRAPTTRRRSARRRINGPAMRTTSASAIGTDHPDTAAATGSRRKPPHPTRAHATDNRTRRRRPRRAGKHQPRRRRRSRRTRRQRHRRDRMPASICSPGSGGHRRFSKSRNPTSAAANGPDQKSHSDGRPVVLRSAP